MENRTPISGLENPYNNPYTISAFIILVLTVGVEPTPVRILSPMRLPIAQRKHILWMRVLDSNQHVYTFKGC